MSHGKCSLLNFSRTTANKMDLNIKIKNLSEIDPRALRQATTDSSRLKEVEAVVADIINDVSKRGDAAVLEYTEKFDKVSFEANGLRVSKDEIENAFGQIDGGIIKDLQIAKENIKKYHEKQVPNNWEIQTSVGVFPGLITRPLQKVGIYVPGGKAFYPSTVLMCAIPAKVAGVARVIMVTPPKPDGTIEPIVLVSAKIAGVEEIYKIGGAQAIAALGKGTKTIPKVDKIVGPGNAYVSMAKKLLQGEVLIDSPAGPSEVLIVASRKVKAKYLALDVCAQAEHDEDAVSIALVENQDQANELVKKIEQLIPTLGRSEIILESLNNNGLVIVLGMKEHEQGYLDSIASTINAIAPEHLQLSLEESLVKSLIPKIQNAGAIFLGEMTPVAMGDYASGTNHVLPTNGMATRYSALNTLDFLKIIPVTRSTMDGLRLLGPIVAGIARFEKLDAHARSVEERIESGE